MSKYSSLSREELERRLEVTEGLIDLHKDVISEKMAKSFVQATKKLCDGLNEIGAQLIEILASVCTECPYRQDVPCAACKLIETHEMSAEEREAQRRSFAHGNAAMHNPNVTRELIDQEAEKMKAEKPEVP